MKALKASAPAYAWRAHHVLLCSSTFIGAGYTEAYATNLRAMMQAINRQPEGVFVRLVEGPDDWCRPLLAATDEISREVQAHCLNPSVAQRDILALADLAEMLGEPIKSGDVILLSPPLIAKFRDGFGKATRARDTAQDYASPRRGCQSCQWGQFCDKIARQDYRNVVLYPPDQGPQSNAASSRQ